MTKHTRREFLMALARRAAYAAPVIVSLSAPHDLLGQGSSSQHKAHAAPTYSGATQQTNTPRPPGGAAPWKAPPPGAPPKP